MQFTQNISQADETLQSDGWTKGCDGYYAKNGKQLAFTIIVVSGYSDYVADCQVMVKDLQAAGINATMNAMSNDAFTSALGNVQYAPGILCTTPPPTPYYIYIPFSRTTTPPPTLQP